MNTLRVFQYKYIKNQTGIAVKKVKVNPDSLLCKLGRAHIPSPNAIGLLVPEKENFKGFLPYMGMAAILVM